MSKPLLICCPTMLKSFLKTIGWVHRGEREGKEIDFTNSWEFERINKKNEFMSWIIEYVPKGSIWSVEGLHDENIYEVLKKYQTDDTQQVNKGTIWPRQAYLKVILTEESKQEILSRIDDWDLNSNIIHQHIYFKEQFFLTSYDNLDEGCTWITKDIAKGELDKIEAKSIAKLNKHNYNRD